MPLLAQVIRILFFQTESLKQSLVEKNKGKATGTTVCAGTKNEALGDIASIGSGDNNKAEGK